MGAVRCGAAAGGETGEQCSSSLTRSSVEGDTVCANRLRPRGTRADGTAQRCLRSDIAYRRRAPARALELHSVLSLSVQSSQSASGRDVVVV